MENRRDFLRVAAVGCLSALIPLPATHVPIRPKLTLEQRRQLIQAIKDFYKGVKKPPKIWVTANDSRVRVEHLK